MNWLLGGIILLGVGVALHRLLRMSDSPPPRARGLIPLSPDLDAIYQPVALEVETQSAILGISLNEAFDERDAQHAEMAWRLVQLGAGEWDRMAQILTDLLSVVSKRLSSAQTLVPARSIAADRFKSRAMIDYVRLHELLDKLVFSSRRRFQLQIRLLRGAVSTLTEEFRRTYHYGEGTRDCSQEVWTRLDLYFHDYDMTAKETLLALRALLACLPAEAVQSLAAELHALLQRGVRHASLSVD